MALIFKWSLDSVSTELINSLPGTLNGTAAFTASDGVGGCYGPLVASDSETGLVCDISSVPFNPDTGGTISFFMKTPATVSSKVAVGFMGATGANDLNGLFVEFDSLVPTAKWPKDESSQVSVTDSSGVISGNMGQWHHIALVWTGLLTQAEVEAGGLTYVVDTSYHNIAIYIDGVSSASGVYQTKTGVNSSLTRTFTIGWHDSDQTNGGILFDDVSVYNEVLTGATINTLKTTFIAGLTEDWETGGTTQYVFPFNNSLTEENNPSLSFSLNKEVSPPFTATAIRGVASYGPTVYQTDSIPLYGTLSLPGTFSLVNGGSFHFFFRNDRGSTQALGVGFLDTWRSQTQYNNFIIQLGYNSPTLLTPAGCMSVFYPSGTPTSTTRIPKQIWTHLCATLGRVVGTDKYRARMYVNGVLKGEREWTLGATYANAINELSAKPFYLDYNLGNIADADVVIDHLVILDKELTEAEVQAAAITCYPNGDATVVDPGGGEDPEDPEDPEWAAGGSTQYVFPFNNSLREENNPSLSFSLNKEGATAPFTAKAMRGAASYGPTAYQLDQIPLYGTLTLPEDFSLVNGGSFHFFFRNDRGNTNVLGVGFLDTWGSSKEYNNFILQLGYNSPTLLSPAGCLSAGYSSGTPAATTRIPKQTWTHLCATLGRVVGTDKYRARMYVNGVLKGERIWSLGATYANAINELSAKPFYLDFNKGNTTDTDVVIDHLVILDKELSEAEVQAAAMTCYPNGVAESASNTENTGTRYPCPEGYTYIGAPRVRTNPPEDVEAITLSSVLKVFIIDAETIVVSGNFSDFYTSRLHEEYGVSMYYAELDWRVGTTADWLMSVKYKYCYAELQKDYEPLISDKYASDNYFLVNGDSVTVVGNWVNASDIFFVLDVYDQARVQSTARGNRIHHAYLRLPTPMTEGEEYTVTDLDGNTVSFTYSKAKPVSSIKVNQVGYSPSAGRKYAYFGAWLGTGGALEKSFDNQPFYLKDATTGDTAYTGTMELRDVQDVKYFSENNYIITGEKVYQCDFSDFNTVGRYQVFIPGVGYSHPFLLDEEAIQKQFYTHARGLFHQRSGCAKGPPHTQALNLPADFKTTYKGSFPPNNRDYKGFCGDSQFEAIKRYDEAGTQVALRDVYGSWWDAADWDRRPYHFRVVGDLLNAYIFNPSHFCDNQLDLPESGNGIPDILSEAEWGLDIWRKLQLDNGGVGCWVEMRSHPRYPDFAHTSKIKMYSSTQTCEGSLQYAFYAAKFVVCLRLAAKQISTSAAGALLAMQKADLFLESAIRAFDYGMDDANLAAKTYNAGNITEIWSETPTLRDTYRFLAAQALYAATLSDKYKQRLTLAEYRALSVTTVGTDGFCRYIPHEIFLVDGFDDIKAAIRYDVVRDANKWLTHMDGYAYRNVHYSNTWITYMSWGVGHSATRGKVFASAYWLTQDERYKEALFLILDWNVGCNALGRSHTTGLGTVTPVRFLYNVGDWVRERDLTLTAQEPPPGITVYTYGGTALMQEANQLFGIYESARSGESNFAGVSLNLLPGEYRNTVPNINSQVRVWLALNRPIWRAYSALEGYTVAQNEYTVSETIGPNVLCAAACLSSSFTPPASWKEVTPSSDYRTCEGYVFLP